MLVWAVLKDGPMSVAVALIVFVPVVNLLAETFVEHVVALRHVFIMAPLRTISIVLMPRSSLAVTVTVAVPLLEIVVPPTGLVIWTVGGVLSGTKTVNDAPAVIWLVVSRVIVACSVKL